MCGIAGYSGHFSSGLLSDMINIISHRGPDDKGLWINHDQLIGLAHARLSIIDLSAAGHQPMTNEDKTIWLTYNGEIYNYRELRSDLLQKGHIFKSMTDSEVLLHLYEEEGHDMLKKLEGIFSFAIWDQDTKELFIARDALGVKPLYYAEIETGFLFASELKSILACKQLSHEIDNEAVSQYMTYLWSPAPKTMLKYVQKVRPAHCMRIKNGKIIRDWRWYRIPYNGVYLSKPEDDVSDELALKVQNAVRRQLVSDVPVGAFLSGGLDSSAVVAMMSRALAPGGINCYSIGFDNASDMEGSPLDMPYARKASKHLGVHLHEIVVKPAELVKHIEELIYCLDEPQADPAPLNAMIIAQRARKDGIKVLLSGTGGDDIFTGYRRHTALLYEKYWGWLPLSARKVLMKSSSMPGLDKYAIVRRMKKMFRHANLPGDQRLVSYFKWSSDELRWNLLSRDLKNGLQPDSAEKALLESLKEIPDEREPVNKMLYLETRHFLADHNLNYTDKTSMKYGVEVRVPLLDTELVEYAASIPVSMKQKGQEGKAIFKKAMEPYLPSEIIYRKKTGFGAPLRKWIKDDLREMVDELLSERSIKSRGLFDDKAVRALIEKNQKGIIDGAYTIFSLLCIELWCRIFLGGAEVSHGK